MSLGQELLRLMEGQVMALVEKVTAKKNKLMIGGGGMIYFNFFSWSNTSGEINNTPTLQANNGARYIFADSSLNGTYLLAGPGSNY
jgi:hypothetical protein